MLQLLLEMSPAHLHQEQVGQPGAWFAALCRTDNLAAYIQLNMMSCSKVRHILLQGDDPEGENKLQCWLVSLLPITNYQMAPSKQGAGGGSATHKEPT